MRAKHSVAGRVGHRLQHRVEDVDAHGRPVGIGQHRLVVRPVELAARLKRQKICLHAEALESSSLKEDTALKRLGYLGSIRCKHNVTFLQDEKCGVRID